MWGTTPQLNSMYHEVKPPVSVIDYMCLSCWALGSYETPLQHYIVSTIGFPPQLGGKPLLLKILTAFLCELQ